MKLNLLKFYCFMMIFLPIRPLPCWGQYSYQHLKNLSAPLHEEFKELSPVKGILWTPMVENIYDLGESSTPQKTLVNLLFQRLGPQHFGLSQINFSLAPYLNHYRVGLLKGLLLDESIEKFSYKNKSDDEFIHNKAKEILDQVMSEVFEQKSLLGQLKMTKDEAWRIIERLKELAAKEDQNEETKEAIKLWEQVLKKYLNLNNGFDGDFPRLFQRVDNYYGKEGDLASVSKTDIYKNFLKIIKYMIKNKNERENLLPIFDAFMWMKTTHKKDYWNYYLGLKSGLSKVVKEGSLENYFQQKFLLGDKNYYEDWLNSKYEYSDPTQEYFKLSYDEKNPENLLFALQSRVVSHRPLTTYGDYQGLDGRYADCGETELRNFIKILINKGDGLYDAEELKKINPSIEELNPALYQFFKKNNTTEKQLSEDVRNEWDDLVSDFKSVDYVKEMRGKKCEIDSGSTNLLNGFLELFHLNKERPNNTQIKNKIPAPIENWHQLFDYLHQVLDQRIELQENLLDQHHKFGSLVFKTRFEGRFQWHFNREHFYMSPLNNTENEKELSDYLMNVKNLKTPLPQDFLSVFPANYMKMNLLIDAFKKSNNIQPLYLNNYGHKESIFLTIFTFWKNKDAELNSHKSIIHFLKKLYFKLSRDEDKLAFIAYAPPELAVSLVDDLKKMIEEDRNVREIIFQILSQETWKNYPELVEMIIDRYSYDDDVAEYVLTKSFWKNHPHLVVKLIDKNNSEQTLLEKVLTKSHWQYHPILIDHLLKNNKYHNFFVKFLYQSLQNLDDESLGVSGADKFLQNYVDIIDHFIEINQGNAPILAFLIEDFLSLSQLKNLPYLLQERVVHWIEKLIEIPATHPALAESLLSQKYWLEHPFFLHWMERMMAEGQADEEIITNILSRSSIHEWPSFQTWVNHFIKKGQHHPQLILSVLRQYHLRTHPSMVSWLKEIIQRGQADAEVIEEIFPVFNLKAYPELVVQLVKNGKSDNILDLSLFTNFDWKFHPYLKVLSGGKDVLAKNIREGLNQLEISSSHFLQATHHYLCQHEDERMLLHLPTHFELAELEKILKLNLVQPQRQQEEFNEEKFMNFFK